MINSLPTHRHEDDRRVLTEWVRDFPLRTCKALEVKQDSILGDHFHKEKDEVFYLLKGSGFVTLDSDRTELKVGDVIYAARGVKHTFELAKDSILLEAGNKPFDPTDDYK